MGTSISKCGGSDRSVHPEAGGGRAAGRSGGGGGEAAPDDAAAWGRLVGADARVADPAWGASGSYWADDDAAVLAEIEARGWAVSPPSATRLHLGDWAALTRALPADPYVERRWKVMAWIALDRKGRARDLGHCPMAQGGAYNDAATMANVKRVYERLDAAVVARPDFQRFAREWAALWGIGPDEPILFQVTGVRGEGGEVVDPLQGQGVHQDGCRALSVVVLTRNSVDGAESTVLTDKAGTGVLCRQTLAPGQVIHIRDDRVFHSVSGLRVLGGGAGAFDRFIIIINARFVDQFQNRELRKHFPDAVLDESSAAA